MSGQLFRVLSRLPQGNAFWREGLIFQEDPHGLSPWASAGISDHILEMTRDSPPGSLRCSFQECKCPIDPHLAFELEAMSAQDNNSTHLAFDQLTLLGAEDDKVGQWGINTLQLILLFLNEPLVDLALTENRTHITSWSALKCPPIVTFYDQQGILKAY